MEMPSDLDQGCKCSRAHVPARKKSRRKREGTHLLDTFRSLQAIDIFSCDCQAMSLCSVLSSSSFQFWVCLSEWLIGDGLWMFLDVSGLDFVDMDQWRRIFGRKHNRFERNTFGHQQV